MFLLPARRNAQSYLVPTNELLRKALSLPCCYVHFIRDEEEKGISLLLLHLFPSYHCA